MITELLMAFGLIAPPNIGDCYKYDVGATITQCHYQAPPQSLIAIIGKEYMLGPWADLQVDLINPAIMSLSTNKTVIINVTLGGDAVLTLSGDNALIANSTFDSSGPKLYAIKVLGK